MARPDGPRPTAKRDLPTRDAVRADHAALEHSDNARNSRPCQQASGGLVAGAEARELDNVVVAQFGLH